MDVVVLEKDIMSAKENELRDLKAFATFIEGKKVFSEPEFFF